MYRYIYICTEMCIYIYTYVCIPMRMSAYRQSCAAASEAPTASEATGCAASLRSWAWLGASKTRITDRQGVDPDKDCMAVSTQVNGSLKGGSRAPFKGVRVAFRQV